MEAAALANAGELAASLPRAPPLYDVDDAGPPCVAAKVKTPALLKLKMLLDAPSEVFQKWEQPEEDEQQQQEEEPCFISQGPLYYNFFHHDLPAFDLEEESTIQPSRHTDAPATELNWSANIISIRVLSSAVGYPLNLYGSVYVRDALDRKRVYLFRRDRDNAQLVKYPEETLALTGPSRGLFVCDTLFFEIDLKMRCEQEVDGINFSQGSMEYSNVSNSSWLLNHRSYLLTDELATEVSTVKLIYAPVRRAVEASIQIKAHEGSPHREEGLLSPYGKVTAFITDISEEIILFDSESSGIAMNIRDDGSFDLWRSVVSVPIDGSLTLRVETWEGDSRANFSRCSTIFTPQICDENVSACAFHPIRIKVSWSPLYIPKFDNHKITF